MPGEKGSLQAQLAESEKRMEKIKQRIQAIEEEEKAAREAATKSVETKAEQVAEAGDPAASAATVASAVSTDAGTEEAKEIVAEAAETPEHELQKDTAEPEAPVAGEASPGADTQEKTAPEVFEKMLKSDLLKLCLEKGIEADKKMTKPKIIELILKRS